MVSRDREWDFLYWDDDTDYNDDWIDEQPKTKTNPSTVED